MTRFFYLIPFSICILLSFCKQAESKVTDKVDIKKLNTSVLQDSFLVNLWHEDQANRDGTGYNIIQQFGYDSKQYKSFRRQAMKNDSAIYARLLQYLELYGYPDSPSEFSELALNSFVSITGHQGNITKQLKAFPSLARAFKDGRMSDDDFVHLLGEMYQSSHRGQLYDMPKSRFTVKEEIDSLLSALNLELP